jgi:uncharacterized membrane protein
MFQILNTWQFNLVAYLVFIVLFFQSYKLAVRNAKRDGAATVLLQLIAGVSILLLAPLLALDFPTSPKYWLLIIIASIFYALNDRLQTTARKHLPVSTYSIINQFTTIFLIAIGLVIFKEPLVTTKLVGAGLILLANILLVYKRDGVKINRNIWVAILATLVFSVAISVDIGISKQFNLPFYIMLTLIIPAVMVFFVERIKTKEVVDEYKSKSKNWYLITGVSWGLAIFFSLRSFNFGNVTTIVPLQATAVLLNVLMAYLFLGEREERLKKIIAAGLVIVGVYLTVL